MGLDTNDTTGARLVAANGDGQDAGLQRLTILFDFSSNDW